MRKILNYFKYCLFSKTKYSIHSPFIYEFTTKVLNDNTKYVDYEKIENLRSELKNSNEKIIITDFGAGSTINKSNVRTIKDICSNSAKNKKYAALLYRIRKHYNSKSILEIGTSLGISACYLAIDDPTTQITTIEGCPNTANIAKNNFKKLNLDNVNLCVGNFDNILPAQLLKLKKIDLIFIDGNHRKQPTIDYFEKCLLNSHDKSIFIFDDIHWSKGMQEAWHYIKFHPKTTATIDLFFIGIVFVNPELKKEHFSIKF